MVGTGLELCPILSLELAALNLAVFLSESWLIMTRRTLDVMTCMWSNELRHVHSLDTRMHLRTCAHIHAHAHTQKGTERSQNNEKQQFMKYILNKF